MADKRTQHKAILEYMKQGNVLTPLKWVIIKLFVAVLKLHTWVCTNLNETLNLPDND